MIGRSRIWAAVLLAGCSGGSPDEAPRGDDAPGDLALASEAFVWGYALVVSERTMQGLGSLLGVNALFHQTALANAASAKLKPTRFMGTITKR